jgi:hypothetical protein
LDLISFLLFVYAVSGTFSPQFISSMGQGEKDSTEVATSGDRNNEVEPEGNCIELNLSEHVYLPADAK